jgi:AcrR family transcriptional regulator
LVKTALERAREAPGSTKARILAAAEHVFAARGFSGASTREIATRAEVNISSLHYHWESKERLYFAVFQDIFERIVDLLQNTLTPLLGEHQDRERVIALTMRQLFDFFAEHPTVPKLLLRRIVDSEASEVGIERDILGPAWTTFSQWLTTGSRPLDDAQARLFILSMYSVTLVYLLDSQSFQSVLGGSVRGGAVREQVREHLIDVVKRLLRSDG